MDLLRRLQGGRAAFVDKFFGVEATHVKHLCTYDYIFPISSGCIPNSKVVSRFEYNFMGCVWDLFLIWSCLLFLYLR